MFICSCVRMFDHYSNRQNYFNHHLILWIQKIAGKYAYTIYCMIACVPEKKKSNEEIKSVYLSVSDDVVLSKTTETKKSQQK